MSSISDGNFARRRRHPLLEVLLHTLYLGFTSFGGPAVHFQIFHQKFVQGKDPWLDEQTYQELFAICQSLPGPASTKMGFCITLQRGGVIAAIIELLTWSLPGAIAMYALAIGVSRISTTLPTPVYALLTGLNASTVGVIAFAAVQLASKAITDKLSRVVVIASACAGLCYSALWYFPVLMMLGGGVTVVWDMWARSAVGRLAARVRRGRRGRRASDGRATTLAEDSSPPRDGAADEGEGIALEGREVDVEKEPVRRQSRRDGKDVESAEPDGTDGPAVCEEPVSATTEDRAIPGPVRQAHAISVRVGLAIIVVFFASFTVIMVVNAAVKSPLEVNLFRKMYLAGTIIFGGGPVVVPLLREYVVAPGWVSARDFLIGLAIIQAMPGPNFNFAVYLGALTLAPTRTPSVVGALLGYIAIFAPGIVLAMGFQSIWSVLRSRPAVVALLRGVNAAAVGLVFTAVYRLWEIGYLTPGGNAGLSLGNEPWWVVVAALAFTSTAWFGVETWMAILAGSVLGLCWFGVVRP